MGRRDAWRGRAGNSNLLLVARRINADALKYGLVMDKLIFHGSCNMMSGWARTIQMDKEVRDRIYEKGKSKIFLRR